MGRRPGVAPLPAAVVLVVTAAAVALVACAARSSSSAGAAGSWERAPTAPLSAREHALGVWTGREAIVFGGSGPPYYSPGWEGPTVEKPPLRDGAAFDPRTRSWRRVAPAPVGIDLSTAVVVGNSVYVAVPAPHRRLATRRVLLAYRVEADRWQRVPSPPKRGHVQLLAAGDRLVALAGRPVPPPLAARPVLERTQAGPDHHRAARPGRPGPAARPRGDAGYGRPLGGILDPERGVWSDLPELPATFDFEFGSGALTRTLGTYQFPHGWVLDMARHEWLLIPPLPTGWGFEWGGATAVGMNRDLLAFGGPRYGRKGRGRLVNEAWIWSPPAPAPQRTE